MQACEGSASQSSLPIPSFAANTLTISIHEAVLANLRTFCERCDLYAMIVLIPGVNDGLELEKTCQDLSDMGAKGLMLMSFANDREQGLIFGNEPIMPTVGTLFCGGDTKDCDLN